LNYELEFTNGKTMPVGTMYCIGQNYSEHIKEMGSVASSQPVVFLKPPTAYLPNGGKIQIPSISDNAHHEVELVAVVGKQARHLSLDNALEYISGFAVGIDVTLRDIQQKAKEKGHPWAVAKGFATSAPISKIVPLEELKGKCDFDLVLTVNNQVRQSDSTQKMERTIEELLVYLSSIFVLMPGDVIFTGTPKGVERIISGDSINAKLDNITEISVTVE